MLLGGDLGENTFQFGVVEHRDPAALGADQVIVLSGSYLGLVPLESLIEVVLGRQSKFHEQGQCTIDRGLAGMFAPLTQGRRYIIRRQVAGGLEQDLRDGLPLVCEREFTLT